MSIPKWAQEKIERLERLLKDRDAVIVSLKAAVEPTSIYYTTGRSDHPVFIPDHARIFFKKKSGAQIDLLLDHQDNLRVYARDLTILPMASNSVYIDGK